MSDYVYGKNSFNEVLKSRRIQEVYLLNDSPYLPIVMKNRLPYRIVKKGELDKIAKGGNHQGIIARVDDYRFSSVEEMMKKENGLIIILDGLKDVHNLGAVIRTCDAAGADGIIYKKHNSVKVNDTVAKVASGALEYVKIAEVTNLTSTIKKLKENNYWIVGTDASASDSYTDLKYDMNTCLIIGSEGEGISRLVKEECDFMIKLPMKGHVNSLNASVAAGILIYNVLAQRERFSTKVDK